MKITIIIITLIFTLFPNLITKESYNWWLTRRRMEIHTKISEEKYPKVSVANIGSTKDHYSGENEVCEIS